MEDGLSFREDSPSRYRLSAPFLRSAIFRMIQPHHQHPAEIVFLIEADQIEKSITLRLCDSGHGLQIRADAERAVLQKPHPSFLFEYLRARFALRFIGIIFLRQIIGLRIVFVTGARKKSAVRGDPSGGLMKFPREN
jgi:hypothetical protein